MVTRSQKCGATKEMQYLQQDLEATPDNRDGDDEGMKNIWVMKTVRSVKTMTMKTSVWVLTTVALVRNLNKI